MEAAGIRTLVEYVCAANEQHFGGSATPSATVADIVRAFTAMSSKTRPLSSGESGVVTLLRPKTAALVADRVWLQFPGADDRLDFAFGWESPMAIRLGTLFVFMQREGNVSSSRDASLQSLSGPAADFVAVTEGDLARDYCRRCATQVSPLYRLPAQRDADYKAGDYPGVISVVENVAVVQEEALTWEQVLQFRQDLAARDAYRRFVHWLDKEMAGQSSQFICDAVSDRLDAYRWALHKHGLESVIGVLQRTISASSLFGAGAASVAVQSLANQPLVAALAGAGLLVGQAALHASTALIQRQDILVQNRDIAFVHEVRGKVGAASTGLTRV